jgi:Holliday junction resolvasome RuvABC endonuclease subunit
MTTPRACILGIDPSFRATGVVTAVIDDDGNPQPIHVDWIPTKRSPDRKRMYAADDDILSAQVIVERLSELITEANPSAIFVETPGGSQSSSGARANGIVLGILASLANKYDTIPFVWINAAEVKKGLLGTHHGTKKEIEDAVVAVAPDLHSVMAECGVKQKKGKEAVVDALATILAARDTDVYKLLQIGEK